MISSCARILKYLILNIQFHFERDVLFNAMHICMERRFLMIGKWMVNCIKSYRRNRLLHMSSPTVGFEDQKKNSVHMKSAHDENHFRRMIGLSMLWGALVVLFNASLLKVHSTNPRFVIQIALGRLGKIKTPLSEMCPYQHLRMLHRPRSINA